MGSFNTNVPRELKTYQNLRIVRPAPLDQLPGQELVNEVEEYLAALAIIEENNTLRRYFDGQSDSRFRENEDY